MSEKFVCPHCGKEIDAASIMGKKGGSSTSPKKAEASRQNGKLYGGRPKKPKP
jgi:hypothetical protein